MKETHAPTLDALGVCLKQGLHVESVRQMRDICHELAAEATHPLPFYVLESIFDDLDSAWNGTALDARNHELAQKKLTPPLRQVVFAIQRQAGDEEMAQRINRLLSAFIRLQRDGTIA